MYSDTVTIFNRYESRLGDMWYPTVLRGVNFMSDRSAIVQKYGEQSKDNAVVNVRYDNVNGKVFVVGKEYFPPKEWDRQTNDMLTRTITFTPGEKFDFFYLGEYSEEPISDDDYTEGFYDYMNSTFDGVFAITSVAKLDLIPHFEITGK